MLLQLVDGRARERIGSCAVALDKAVDRSLAVPGDGADFLWGTARLGEPCHRRAPEVVKMQTLDTGLVALLSEALAKGLGVLPRALVAVGDPPQLFCVVTPNEGPVVKKKAFDQFPGLFLEFATIEQSPEAVLGFAGKFGLLQFDRENELIWWFQYQRDFAELTALKKRVKLHDVRVGRGQLSPETLLKFNQLAGLEIALPGSRLSALDRVNRVFQTGITARISWCGRAAGVVIQPTSLLAAMALQLGLWLGAETEYIGQCPECGTTFEYGPGTGRRASRRYCSLRCQETARYARRKK